MCEASKIHIFYGIVTYFYICKRARGRAVKSAVQIHRTLVSNPKVLGSNPTRGTLGKVSENQFLGPTNAM